MSKDQNVSLPDEIAIAPTEVEDLCIQMETQMAKVMAYVDRLRVALVKARRVNDHLRQQLEQAQRQLENGIEGDGSPS